jgi:hypothetical protein
MFVPTLVKEFDSVDRHFRKNMLKSETGLGRRPLLPDYLDDDVSAAVELPAQRRPINDPAREFTLD